MTTVSIDAMGGDYGPPVVIPGAAISHARNPQLRFVFHGDRDILSAQLDRLPELGAVSRIEHSDVAVRMDDKPSQALRHGRRHSSMWKSIEALKSGDADVCVSAGNTGALMAMARFCLKTMSDVERPAIAAIWPTLRGESIVLDVGATIGADSHQLVGFAVMGAAMARALIEVQQPTVGLLNVGVEEIKGQEMVKEAGRILREANLAGIDYHGFVEGDDLGKGTVDVVVTEGFSGNIALKTAEGTARQIGEYLRSAMGRTVFSRLGYLMARGAFARLSDKMDPRKVNGGVFLGLNGIVVKSHGGADAEGFAAAVDMAHDMVRNGLLTKMGEDIDFYHASHGRALREALLHQDKHAHIGVAQP